MTKMDEYIKRKAALALVKPDAPEDEKAAVTIATAKKLVRSIIQRAPAADVAPVVRCEYCKYWHKETLFCDYMRYGEARERVNWYADDFCSYGELKEGAD